MQPILWLPLSCALIVILTGCANNGSSGNDPLGTGPFDSAGNYHEEWANDPSKWSKPGKRTKQPTPSEDLLPLVAKNEQPPPNANPLAPQGSAYPKTPTRVAATPRQTTRHAEVPKTTVAKANATPQVATSSAKPRSHVATNSAKPRSHVAEARTKSHSSKSKSKSSSARYTVKKGDSLSAIASRTGSSVSAIQKANGISGTLIHPGKTLVIPKR